jgi:hypothetical protein
MRLLWIVTFVLALASAYFGYWCRTSFSAYSDAQLAGLADGYRDVLARARGNHDEAAVSLAMTEDEVQRRQLAPVVWIATGIAFALAVASSFRRKRASALIGEDMRLQAAIGDPALIEAGARHKAAALLSVTIDAPREVVVAAYEAQRKLHERDGFEGLAPDLRRLVRERIAALEKARDLLVGETRKAA